MATAKKAPAAKKAAPAKSVPAKTHTPRGLKQDRKEVAGGQKYEVEYEAKKLGVKPAEIKKAIKTVGNSRAAIEKAVKKK